MKKNGEITDKLLGYSFRRATDEESKLCGGAKICDIYEIFEYEMFPMAYGQLMTLFGDADFESENLENQYTYNICVIDDEGRENLLMVYSGPTGPSIGGADNAEKAAEALVELIRKAEPSDYEYTGYYMDGPSKVSMGVKNGNPFMDEDELELSEEEFTKLYSKLYGLDM